VRTLLQEAVPAAMEAALTDLKVRRYNISGKEADRQGRWGDETLGFSPPYWLEDIVSGFPLSCGLVFTKLTRAVNNLC